MSGPIHIVIGDCGNGKHSLVWPERLGAIPSVSYLICEKCGFEFGVKK